MVRTIKVESRPANTPSLWAMKAPTGTPVIVPVSSTPVSLAPVAVTTISPTIAPVIVPVSATPVSLAPAAVPTMTPTIAPVVVPVSATPVSLAPVAVPTMVRAIKVASRLANKPSLRALQTPTTAPVIVPVSATPISSAPVAVPTLTPTRAPVIVSVSAGPVPAPPLPSNWLVNAGSSTAFTDESGKVWQPDVLSSGLAIDEYSTFSFTGLDNPDLLCKYRKWSDKGSSGLLEFPVKRGFYSVKLYFSETSTAAGERVVDIFFEGSKVLAGLDVAALLDGSYGVYTFTISSNVVDGATSVEISASKGSPVLAAVEIFESTATAPVPTPTTVPTPSPSPVTFNLIYTPTNQIVKSLGNGDVIDLSQFGLQDDKFNVQAVPLLPNVDKVFFVESDRTEGVEPYAFCGDISGSYFTCAEFQKGKGLTTVTAILLDGLGATIGTAVVSFEIVQP